MNTRISDLKKDPYSACLELAIGAKPFCRPNPAVGAVIVHRGQIIGQGLTSPVEAPCRGHGHSFVRNPLLPARSEMFVSLMPCATRGRTPPCVELIIRSGLRKLHVANLDNSPDTYSSSLNLLRKKGVSVKMDFPSRRKAVVQVE